jgi:hypothetical protein
MRELFDKLVPEFRVSMVDWPGFDDRARPRADWTPEALSAFLNWFLSERFLSERFLSEIVPPAHSAPV